MSIAVLARPVSPTVQPRAVRRLRAAAKQWLCVFVKEYGWPELSGTICMVAGFIGTLVFARSLLAATAAAWLWENIGFYGHVSIRAIYREYQATSHHLGWRRGLRIAGGAIWDFRRYILAELIDTGLRNLLIYQAINHTQHVLPWEVLVFAPQVYLGAMTIAFISAKLAADLVFFLIADSCARFTDQAVHYIRRGFRRRRRPRGAYPAAITAAPPAPSPEPVPAEAGPAPAERTPTVTPPYLAQTDRAHLIMDLTRVQQLCQRAITALPGQLHWAMKCMPVDEVICTVTNTGMKIEVASLGEINILHRLGLDVRDAIFSNPVKPSQEIAAAHRLGVWRFAADSPDEIRKLAKYAPGSSVLIRMEAPDTGPSEIPSEGKFGINVTQAVQLALYAASAGLNVYGLAFHVGSQMLNPQAYALAIAACGEVMRELQEYQITIKVIDYGGGFPARYVDAVPPLEEYGQVITEAVNKHIPGQVDLIGEIGRAAVAEAAIYYNPIAGKAIRRGQTYLHGTFSTLHGGAEIGQTQGKWQMPYWDNLGSQSQEEYILTGLTCDSADTIGKVMLSADLRPDRDVILIGTAGAYVWPYAVAFNEVPTAELVFGSLDDVYRQFGNPFQLL